MEFQVLCANMLALLFGLALCFAGYRLFMALLPIWGFFFGFALGAESLQALFGTGFLSTTTSWVVGFIVGAFFAVLSYLFYRLAVIILAASLGYALGIGLTGLFGFNLTLWTWLVGIGGALIGIAAVLFFAIERYLIIVATGMAGAAVIVATLVLSYTGPTVVGFAENPVRTAIQNSPWWALFYVLLAAAGIAVQIWATRDYVIRPYRHAPEWSEGGK